MIDIIKYQKVLDTGLNLDHYHVLMMIKNDGVLPKNKRVQGFINLLTKKGYIEEGILTQKALQLLDNYVSTTTTWTTTAPVKDENGRIDFNSWVKNLHEKCQGVLKEWTGEVQVRSKINKNDRGYPFLCNQVDLGKVLSKVILTYKLKDLDAVEKCILSFIEGRCQSKNYFPLVRYYILKDGRSDLVTDLECPVPETTKPFNNNKFL